MRAVKHSPRKRNPWHSGLCGKCRSVPHATRMRYCNPCHAANMREWRKTHPLNAEQKIKDTARSYANVYQRRGLLKPKPCEVCGSSNVEKHHDDYSKPLEVRWFCRKHHLTHHSEQQKILVTD